MPKLYTTGEMAALCGTTVRAVQYYDKRGLISPSELSEGGRRLYTDRELRAMPIVCLLRELDFSLPAIKQLLGDQSSSELIAMLIAARQRELNDDIARGQAQLARLRELEDCLSMMEQPSFAAIGDADYVLTRRKKWNAMIGVMLTVGILMDVIEVGTLLLGILRGTWLPFLLGMPLAIAAGVYIVVYYYRHAEYICPICHTPFRPRFRSFLFTKHTPHTRKLSCKTCGHRGFCVETYYTKKKGSTHAEN